jgi:hypothetical protein
MSPLCSSIHHLGRFAIAAFVAVLLPLSAYAAEAGKATDPTIAAGRELSDLFLLGKTGVLWQRMTAPMQAAIKSEDALAAFRKQVEAQLGTEHEVLSETIDTVQGKQVYLRRALWSKAPTAVTMQWALEGNGNVVGFYTRPAAVAEPAPSAYLDYRTRANMRLPFDGEWFVVWGGRTLEQNYHAVSRGQRFAHDLVKVVDDKTHRGNGRELDHYYCWNEKILAPADGRVVAAVDGLPDQAIGTTNTAQPDGNHVILDLGNDEYALLAHLRQRSVRVKTGDRVSAGTELGRCGNSGNTSEPHLHFHLQNHPRFGQGDGLPAFFKDYVVDGKPVQMGELLRGQRVSMP